MYGNVSDKFQLVDSAAKRPQKSFLPREVADSVVARLREHMDPPGRVARSVGMTSAEVVQVLIERTEQERRAAYSRGFAEGRLAAMFPLRPISHAARAAA